MTSNLLSYCSQSRRAAEVFFVFLSVIVMSSNLSFSQYLPIIQNEIGDSIPYIWPLPQSVTYSPNEVIIKFKKDALHLNKLCYNYQGPPTNPGGGINPDQDPAKIFLSQIMAQEYHVDSIISDIQLLTSIKLLGGMHLKRITFANPCTDTLSTTRYGDTVISDNYLWMTLKLNNDTSVVNTCLLLTINFQHLLYIAEPNYYGRLNAIPNDTYYNKHQSYKQISLWPEYTNTQRAWDFQVGSDKVKVGIIDNGIDYLHCDLNYLMEKKVKGGWNYVSNSGNFSNNSSHGTQMAGIIGAYTNGINDGCPHTGIAGIAGGWYSDNKYGCSLYGFKVDIGGQDSRDIKMERAIAAVLGASAHYTYETEIPRSYGVHILNCSWGFQVYTESLRNAFNFAYEQGVSIVCSRGNIEVNNPKEWYPANFDPNWITSVGGLDMEHEKISSSWYGNYMDILAPAYAPHIYTTDFVSGQHYYLNVGRTSAAAAHVSGAIALLISEFMENPKYFHVKPEPEDYQNMIKAAAYDLNFAPNHDEEELKTYIGYDDVSGWGELKIGNIFEILNSGFNLYHEKITDIDIPDDFSGVPYPIKLIAKDSKIKHHFSERNVKVQRREITGSKVLSNYVISKLYIWGRSGLSNRVKSGGLNLSNPLYTTTKFTEVTSGFGGKDKVKGIYHDNNPIVTARTYQYKLFDADTDEFLGYEPELEDIELHFSVFGIKDPTSVYQNLNKENSVLIYPNPTRDVLNMRFKTNDSSSVIIRVYNILGQIVYQKTFNAMQKDFLEISINTNNLLEGIYSVEIYLGYEIYYQKLMVIK